MDISASRFTGPQPLRPRSGFCYWLSGHGKTGLEEIEGRKRTQAVKERGSHKMLEKIDCRTLPGIVTAVALAMPSRNSSLRNTSGGLGHAWSAVGSGPRTVRAVSKQI